MNLNKDDRGHVVNYRATKVYMALERKALWLTVVSNIGQLHTITAGEKFTGAKAVNGSTKIRKFKQLENIPSDLHLTHITTT